MVEGLGSPSPPNFRHSQALRPKEPLYGVGTTKNSDDTDDDDSHDDDIYSKDNDDSTHKRLRE